MRSVSVVAIASGLTALVSLASCHSPNTATDTKTGAPPASAESAGRAANGFRDNFTVSKANLGPTGGNAYFSLEPGQVRTYRSDEGTLVITVTDQTREVDGVTTRVVEEREEENGTLKEISRNFFAADQATGDVYYFGEEVDIYKNGHVANHEGAWLAGVGGARFGLMMPANPRVGDKFYQEIAPGRAMDRFEVASVDETLVTPAGKFDRVVHTKETTPLEKGVGHKWFAPGVGLIKDDESVLVKQSAGK